MGTAQELERVRRELRDVTRPARLATFAGGRAVLFDDRVEIERFVIGLVPGATLTDVVVTGSGRSGVAYLSVSGPDGSRSLRLKSDDADGARQFAAAVRDATGRVPDVQAERDRRIEELGTRVAELTADPRRPAGAEPVPVGGVGTGAPGPELVDPLIDDVPDPPDRPSRAERDAARKAAAAVHLVTDVPGPFVGEAEGGTAPARPRQQKPRKQKPPKEPFDTRRLRKPLALLLGVLLAVGGTAAGVQFLRDRDVSAGTGSGSAEAPEAPEGPRNPGPKQPEVPRNDPPAGTKDDPVVDPGGESKLAKAATALRKRLGRGDVDVLDVEVDGGTLVVDVRQRDPGGMMRQTGEVFAGIHASGIDPGTTVLQHYATIRDPVTGRETLGVVGVYEVTREQSEEIDWNAWGDIGWDNFLTYRNDTWP